MVADIPNVLAAAARSPFRDVAGAGAVAGAKARPGALTYGSAGLGSASHLVGELFARRTGADIVHVPYRGNQPALTDLVGGLEAGIWMGVMAPKGAPEPVVGRLAAALGDALRQPETLARLRAIGAEPAYAPPPDFAARAAAELEQWRGVVRDAGITLQ